VTKYWLAVNGNSELYKSGKNDFWWCVPFAAQKGERVFIYCPRSASQAYMGIFAIAEVVTEPTPKCAKNSYCNAYGGKGQKSIYGYCELKIVERYEKRLVPQSIKLDPALKSEPLVQKNFQATTFELSECSFNHILAKLTALNSQL
jgi:hypothetical protein